jgi:DNA-binding IclR family transcriptional regulator
VPAGVDNQGRLRDGLLFMSSRKFATSLFKALDILTLLSSNGARFKIKEIVGALALPRSSVLRMIDSLMHYGLVERDADREYHVTKQFQQWRMGDWNEQQVALLRPMMKRISVEVEELALLGILEGRHIRYVHFEEPHRRVRVAPPMGKRYDLEVTAMGKLLMSQRPDLIPSNCSAKLKKEIEEARRNNFAWNIRESEPDVITWATWAGTPSTLTHLLVVAWPDFRYAPESLAKAKAIIKDEASTIGPFALFQNPEIQSGRRGARARE